MRPLACDCHLHVYGSVGNYPLTKNPDYIPVARTLADYRGAISGLGFARAILVQPSVYGFDNAMLMDTLANDDESMCRGVVVIAPDADEQLLDRMASLGVRGVRANLVNANGLSANDALALAPRLKARDWHLQLQIKIGEFADLDRYIACADVPVVIDHLGFAPSCDPDGAAFRQLTRLVERGACWVKISGHYRLQDSQVAPLVRRLIDANPERLLWGSDWPHPGLKPHSMPDLAEIVDLLDQWVPDAAIRKTIRVDNPAALYWRPTYLSGGTHD